MNMELLWNLKITQCNGTIFLFLLPIFRVQKAVDFLQESTASVAGDANLPEEGIVEAVQEAIPEASGRWVAEASGLVGCRHGDCLWRSVQLSCEFEREAVENVSG